MASKYDPFWRQQRDQLIMLLEQAAQHGFAGPLGVEAIRSFGERQMWYGRVVVRDGHIVKGGEMAHARSLGNMLASLSRQFPDLAFTARISNDCRLTVTCRGHLGERVQLESAVTSVAPDLAATITTASEINRTQAIHEMVWKLPRYRYPADWSSLPSDGIYFFFEDSEQTPSGPRIVRVGTHRESGRLPARVKLHYTGDRRTSTFRKLLGAALLQQLGHDQAAITEWREERDDYTWLEACISRLLQETFSLACTPVLDSQERMALEKALIATLASSPLSSPSPNWLGRWSDKPAVVASGLWNIQHTTFG